MREYVARIWHHGADDDLFFLAGGVAFSLLLAALPFTLLLISGLASVLGPSAGSPAGSVHFLIDLLLPQHREGGATPVHALIDDVLATRQALGIWSAVLYIWFSSRLFGALRSALAEVFDTETERGIIAGKIFDFRLTVISTVLLIGYLVLNAYIAMATSRGSAFLTRVGIREEVMSGVEYAIGRVIAFALIVMLFHAIYRFLPVRRIPSGASFLGAVLGAVLFEIARWAYAYVTSVLSPGSLYTGTLYTIVSVVFWAYYAAIIFLLGGEVARVHELRRIRLLTHKTAHH